MTDSLYKLTVDEMFLLDQLENLADPEPDPETGEIPDTTGMLGELIQTQMKSEVKLESMIRIIETFEHRAKVAEAHWRATKEIIERARVERDRCTNAVKRIKSLIMYRMDALDEKEITAGARRIKIVGTAASVHVKADAKFSIWEDDLAIMEWKPDKAAIKAHFKETGKLPHGVEIIPGRRVAIK